MAMPFHGLLMFFGCLRPVFRAAKQSRFDCIDAHFAYPDGYAAVLFGKLLRVPVVVSARGTDLDLYPSYRVIRPLIRWTLRNASGIIAVSASLKRAILQLGIPEHKVKVIGNGVDTNRFYPVDRLEARQKLGLPKDAQILVTVCALKPVKGLDLLISAAAQLAASYPRLRLYLVGTGPLYAKLMNLASALGVQDRVFLVGEKPNEELKYWFSAADLSCLTSSREGWPNVVSESIACGTPVVAARVGGIPEILSSPKYGVVVERDTHCIARALREALAKEWDREALVRHARERTWAKVAEEVETYLSSLVKK
jgi:glycosyltransferase involved in cell wall biosynthesis